MTWSSGGVGHLVQFLLTNMDTVTSISQKSMSDLLMVMKISDRVKVSSEGPKSLLGGVSLGCQRIR